MICDVFELQPFDCMDGHDFEYYCAEVLRQNGFERVEVTRGSGDQGVDVIAFKDGLKYAVQCKNYSSRLGNTPIQEVYAGKVFYGCDVAAVMTNQTFTQGAIDLSNATGVLLWDRYELMSLIGCVQNSNRLLRHQNNVYSRSELWAAAIGFSAIALFCWITVILRCIIPFLIGAIIMTLGDNLLKDYWGLPNERWSKAACGGLMAWTILMMIVGFFGVLITQVLELSSMWLWIAFCIYLSLAIRSIIAKDRKIRTERGNY